MSLSSSSWAADSGVTPRCCFWGTENYVNERATTQYRMETGNGDK